MKLCKKHTFNYEISSRCLRCNKDFYNHIQNEILHRPREESSRAVRRRFWRWMEAEKLSQHEKWYDQIKSHFDRDVFVPSVVSFSWLEKASGWIVGNSKFTYDIHKMFDFNNSPYIESTFNKLAEEWREKQEDIVFNAVIDNLMIVEVRYGESTYVEAILNDEVRTFLVHKDHVCISKGECNKVYNKLNSLTPTEL